MPTMIITFIKGKLQNRPLCLLVPSIQRDLVRDDVVVSGLVSRIEAGIFSLQKSIALDVEPDPETQSQYSFSEKVEISQLVKGCMRSLNLPPTDYSEYLNLSPTDYSEYLNLPPTDYSKRRGNKAYCYCVIIFHYDILHCY